MTSPRASARPFSVADERMSALDATFGPFVERVLGRLGIRHAEAAQHVGITRQTFEKSLQPGKVMRATFLYALPIAARIEVVEDMLGESHAVVELPAPHDRGECDMRFLAGAVRQVSDAVSTTLEHATDGHLSRSEGAEIEQRCDRAIGVLLTIRELARSAQREGVIGLRRGK